MVLLLVTGIAAAAGARPPEGIVVGAPPTPEKAPPGSLWMNLPPRTQLLDQNARQVGDLITVQIEEEALAEVLADTETRRESSTGGSIGSLFGVTAGVTEANPNLGGEIGLSVNGNAEFRGDGKTRRSGTVSGVITCRVVQVEPNGNLVVWGWKELRTNREPQHLVLTGVVRPRDITADNTVPSVRLADMNLEFTGSGVVSDKQGPGVLHRVVDRTWPF
jgi:flagellar L-ring protein precursor FlgH